MDEISQLSMVVVIQTVETALWMIIMSISLAIVYIIYNIKFFKLSYLYTCLYSDYCYKSNN